MQSRWIMAIGAFTLGAILACSGLGPTAPPGAGDEAADRDPDDAIASEQGPPEKLDLDLPPCNDGDEAHQAPRGAPGQPTLPPLVTREPSSLQLFNADTDDEPPPLARLPTSIEWVRWCRSSDGTARGPVVFALLDGRFRLFGTVIDGQVSGVVHGYSYAEFPEIERESLELIASLSQGRWHGSIETSCDVYNMNAVCAAGSDLRGAFVDGQRSGPWRWSRSDGGLVTQVEVTYTDGHPSGRATLSEGGSGGFCTETGALDKNGRQGEWIRTCIDVTETEEITRTRYRDDVAQ